MVISIVILRIILIRNTVFIQIFPTFQIAADQGNGNRSRASRRIMLERVSFLFKKRGGTNATIIAAFLFDMTKGVPLVGIVCFWGYNDL